MHKRLTEFTAPYTQYSGDKIGGRLKPRTPNTANRTKCSEFIFPEIFWETTWRKLVDNTHTHTNKFLKLINFSFWQKLVDFLDPVYSSYQSVFQNLLITVLRSDSAFMLPGFVHWTEIKQNEKLKNEQILSTRSVVLPFTPSLLTKIRTSLLLSNQFTYFEN